MELKPVRDSEEPLFRLILDEDEAHAIRSAYREHLAQMIEDEDVTSEELCETHDSVLGFAEIQHNKRTSVTTSQLEDIGRTLLDFYNNTADQVRDYLRRTVTLPYGNPQISERIRLGKKANELARAIGTKTLDLDTDTAPTSHTPPTHNRQT